ncbi:DUF1348 family protein, partial [Streptomyces sp. NPDC018347]|uniref:DUF1348 family protein n=1 Tax=Streptomyces sp. NPDC018347 TaxID=3157193 RepID=UPI0033E8EFD0
MSTVGARMGIRPLPMEMRLPVAAGQSDGRGHLHSRRSETAIQKVRLAEDGWNSRNPERVALAYTPDSYWRNR